MALSLRSFLSLLSLRLDDQEIGGWILGVPYYLDEDGTRVYPSPPTSKKEKSKWDCLKKYLPIQTGSRPTSMFLNGREVQEVSFESNYQVKIANPIVKPDPFFFMYQFLNLFSDRWYPMFDVSSPQVNLEEWFSREHPVKNNLMRVMDHNPFVSLRASIDAVKKNLQVNQFLVFLIGHPNRYLDWITTVREDDDALTTGVRVRCSEGQFQFSLRIVNSHVSEATSDLWLRCENDPLTTHLLENVPEASPQEVHVSVANGAYPDEVLTQLFYFKHSEVNVSRNGFKVRDSKGRVIEFLIGNF